jgi:K+-transporting ATPase ATPase C chain
MIRETANALVACVVTFFLCAVAYPGAVWGLGQLAFPHEAEGSLVTSSDGTVIGSELIAQPFASDRYFTPRPSAVDYKADATGGSNLGTKNPDLHKKLAERAEALKATADAPAPVDLVTASGSGVDPHIAPEAARYQAARVAAARNLSVDQVRALIERHTERSGAIIGAPARVNVLKLNLALDEEKPVAAAPTHAAERAKAAEVQPQATPPSAAAPAAPANPSAASAGMTEEVGAIKARVGEISGVIEKLGKQVELIAKARAAAEEPPGLKSIESKLAGLGNEARKIPQLVSRLDGLSGRVNASENAFKEIQSQLRETRLDIHQLASLAPTTTDRDSRRGGPGRAVDPAAFARKAAIDLGPGVAAYRRGDYDRALRIFRALGRDFPDDARVWYFTALANGLATKQWTGETEDLVARGIDRERAGTPPAADIDAALAGLTRANGKDWLDFYRQRASK